VALKPKFFTILMALSSLERYEATGLF
jgi:hypothetical protein